MKSAELARSIYELYPPFRPWDDTTLEAWTNTVVEKCSKFSPEARADAFASLTGAKHKEKPPQPATILEHLRDAHRWRKAQDNKGQLPVEDGPPGFIADLERAGKRATELCRTPLGRQAAKEGWHGMLWAFIRKHQRHPTPGEIPALQREAKEVDRMGADLTRDASKHGILGPKLLEFWNSVMEQRDKLAREIG